MTNAGRISWVKSLTTIAALGAILALVVGAAGAQTAEFSFFGVSFGMKKAEIEKKWLPLSGGAFTVASPAIKQVRPSFDHEGRLYEFTFLVELSFPDDPATLVNIAFQELLNEKWKKKDSGLIVNLATSRDGSQVTILNERLRAGYIRHLQEKMAVLIQP